MVGFNDTFLPSGQLSRAGGCAGSLLAREVVGAGLRKLDPASAGTGGVFLAVGRPLAAPAFPPLAMSEIPTRAGLVWEPVLEIVLRPGCSEREQRLGRRR